MVTDALKEKEHERDQLKKEWEQRCDEERKYKEIQAMVEKKEKMHRVKMDALYRAAQYVQAHWRGLISRREGEKARKKKKSNPKTKAQSQIAKKNPSQNPHKKKINHQKSPLTPQIQRPLSTTMAMKYVKQPAK